jgi:3-oxoadipate enol-lactonase
MRSLLMVVVMLAAAGCAGPAPELTEEPPVEKVETGYAEFGHSRIYYEIKGTGEPLVLIHGGLLDCRMWDDQFEVLAERYRVIRYDASGHGRSATPPDAYHDHEDLDALMAALSIDRAVIMGLSFGGRVAIDYALEHPDRVVAVVAAGPGLGGFRFDSEEVLEGRQELIEAWGRGEWDRVVELFQRSWTDGPYRSPEEVDPAVREKVRVMTRTGIENAAEGRTMDPPAIDRLDELRMPTLVVVGELDMPDIHEIAELLVAANPNAEKTVIEGVAHMVNMEKPEEFNRVVLEYLEGVNPS